VSSILIDEDVLDGAICGDPVARDYFDVLINGQSMFQGIIVALGEQVLLGGLFGLIS
jgi:hypothetical protein